jgi:hypothetical protein
VRAGIAEDQNTSGSVGRGPEESLEVRVAADHPMQDHHVSAWDCFRICSEVEDAAIHSSGQTCLVQELCRLGVI